jgi:hypothetical protein
MAIQFSMQHFFGLDYIPQIAFGQYVSYFMYTIIPLLILAAIIETILIVKGEKDNNPVE